MRPCFRLASPVLCALVLLSGVSGYVRAQDAVQDHQYTSEEIQAGLRLYSTECALCHGPNGDGVAGVDLRRGQFRRPLSDDDIREVVFTGIASVGMPSFALSPAEANGLVAFIRAGFDPEGTAVKVGNAERGRTLFEGAGNCTDCHRVNGIGPRTAPDLSDVGVIRTPAALQRTLLDPTGAMLPMNRPVRAVTRDGRTIRGRRLNEDTYTVQLIDTEERLVSLVKAELVEYELLRTSAMPPVNVTTDELADLVAYLLSLRGLE